MSRKLSCLIIITPPVFRVRPTRDVEFSLWIQRDSFDGHPVTSLSAPTGWVGFASRLIQRVTLRQNSLVLARMAFGRCHEANTTMTMLMVVPANKSLNPLPCLFNTRKAVHWVSWPILAGAECGLGVGIIIADSWPAVGRRDIHPAYS